MQLVVARKAQQHPAAADALASAGIVPELSADVVQFVVATMIQQQLSSGRAAGVWFMAVLQPVVATRIQQHESAAFCGAAADGAAAMADGAALAAVVQSVVATMTQQQAPAAWLADCAFGVAEWVQSVVATMTQQHESEGAGGAVM